MWEEAAKTMIFGLPVYTFGLYAGAGAALGILLLALLLGRAKWKKGTAALASFLGMGFGFILSRLLFCLMDGALGGPFPVKAMFMVTGGGYSMMGALLGAFLGGALAAKITGQKAMKLLDFMAPALMVFVALERLGEGNAADFGISRPLVGDALKGTFLAVTGDYDAYLATYLLESFAAVLLAVVLLLDLKKTEKPGNTFLLFLLLFGASQTILESLRFDQHMRISFVGLQQVMAIALLGVTVLILSIRRIKERKALALTGIISVPVVVVLGVLLEFMIDRTTISRYLLYLAYLLLAGFPAFIGIRLRKEK